MIDGVVTGKENKNKMGYGFEKLFCPYCGCEVVNEKDTCSLGHTIWISALEQADELSLVAVNRYVNAYKAMEQRDVPHEKVAIALGICYLRKKKYDKALELFQKGIESGQETPDSLFYTAICMLIEKGVLIRRNEIEIIMEYVERALAKKKKGIYYYFLAYIVYNYFERRNIEKLPGAEEFLEMAKLQGVEENEVERLFQLLEVVNPFFGRVGEYGRLL